METPQQSPERDRLVEALLPHAGFDGWSQTSLDAACRDLAWPQSEAVRLFPGGPAQAVDYHNARAVEAMAVEMARRDLSAMKIREKIALGVRLLLERERDNREAIRRTLPLLAMPAHIDIGARCLWRVVDGIWHAIGDNSTDFNYYTKRALLAAVWSSTVLYWLDDRSDNLAKSWEFLDRRIENVMQIEKLKAKLRGGFFSAAPKAKAG